MRKHAILSASAADRWLKCTPSARWEQKFKDTESPYAAEGTLAHAICELKLKKYYTPMSKSEYADRLRALKLDKLYDPEMDGYTETYLDTIQQITYGCDAKPSVAIEKHVDFSDWVPEGFGTADCVVLFRDHLWVIDFKYGKNVRVDAVDNSQLRLYALGAYQAYKLLYPIAQITQIIVQPRMDNISKVDMTAEELTSWAELIKPIAKAAHDGTGEPEAGDHCKFCKCKPACKTYANRYNDAYAVAKNRPPAFLSPDQVATMLSRLDELVAYQKELKAYALTEALKGTKFPGLKIVEGRSNRAFKDVDQAFKKVMAKGYDEALLYERRPITLTAVEKLMGKKEFNVVLADDIVKPKGKPALVPLTDKRPEFRPNSAEDDFGDIDILF